MFCLPKTAWPPDLERTVNRYIEHTEVKRIKFKELQYKDGSTFFNGGYMDYLDENYEEIKPKETIKQNNNKPQYTSEGIPLEVAEKSDRSHVVL